LRRIEPLTRTDHNRQAFDCGDGGLNAFLRQYAAQQADRGVSRTFVLIDDRDSVPREVIGYFTFRPYEIQRSQLPTSAQSGYPNTIGAYLLAKLAVGKGHQGHGIATKLLHDVFRRAIALIDQGGGAGLFVDAKDAGLVDFYANRGFTQLATNSLSLYIPKHTLAQIVDSTPASRF
jgi:GNAT superfamily N-acetyltransferase